MPLCDWAHGLKTYLNELSGPHLQCDTAHIRLTVPKFCKIDSQELLTLTDNLQHAKERMPAHLRDALCRIAYAWGGPFADGEPSDWLLEER